MKTIPSIVIGLVALGTGIAPVIPVSDGYYIRVAPETQAQFSKVERISNIAGLKEAHIIGSACYDRFIDPAKKLEPIRKRIDCEEYWKRANTPNYPTPKIEGMVWGSYVTHLFDTPSGDLDEGYYAKTDDIVEISAAQYLLEQTPVADAAISLDAVSDQTTDSTAVSSLSWTHTVSASASTTVLIGGVGMGDATDADRTVNAFTFNGDSLFKVREDDENTDNMSTAVWQLPDPDLGALTITATLNGSNTVADGGALSIHGVDHYTIDAQASSADVGGSVAGQVTTVANNSWIFVAGATIAYSSANAAYTIKLGGVEIGNFEDITAGAILTGYFGPQVTAGVASTTWTCSGISCATNDWITSNVSFDPNCNAEGDICSQLWRASGTWVAPANLTSVDVACWAGGGGGGTDSGGTSGAGGGGGSFASSTVSITAGNSYAIVVGTGGAADTVQTTATSSFNGTSVVADGALGSDGKTGARGGLASLSTGTVKFNGGTGGNASADAPGGGGGAGGNHGAGNNGANSPATGGSGDAGFGGAGGAAGTAGGSSLLGGGGGCQGPNGKGGVIGGGGGGGVDAGAGTVGAPGACLLTWTYPSATVTTISSPRAIINSFLNIIGNMIIE